VQEPAGADVADLEAEQAVHVDVGERLGAVDREGTDGAAERADLPNDLPGRRIDHAQAVGAETAQVHALAIQAEDGVVRA
jgi:hypothetical protein